MQFLLDTTLYTVRSSCKRLETSSDSDTAMASPIVDGRVEPHRKATYTLHISDQIRREDRSGNGFSSVKCTCSFPKPLL